MLRLIALLAFVLLPNSAFSDGAISCGRVADKVICAAAANFVGLPPFDRMVGSCLPKLGWPCNAPYHFSNGCAAASYSFNTSQTFYFETGQTLSQVKISSEKACLSSDPTRACHLAIAICDGQADPTRTPEAFALFDSSPSRNFLDSISSIAPSTLIKFDAISTGVSFGIGLIIVLLIYAKRAAITNFIIHGRLPYKLAVYGEDIQCLFKRTQRVNWYGRTVFGIVANLSMSYDQLSDVRKYWLGRVVAFDSLRRQRQNQLAKMHLQLATSVESRPKYKKPLSQFLVVLKVMFLFIFYLIRALFSFLFAFLFIRVTIAKLVRGTIIESKDLVLVLQAKEAIEQSATYLKEYLETANTFDGRDEVI